ncbi:Hypothetical predicted protein, partial [Marmota monax]
RLADSSRGAICLISSVTLHATNLSRLSPRSRSSCDGNPSSRFRRTPLLLEIPNKISFSRPDLSYSHTVKQHTG